MRYSSVIIIPYPLKVEIVDSLSHNSRIIKHSLGCLWFLIQSDYLLIMFIYYASNCLFGYLWMKSVVLNKQHGTAYFKNINKWSSSFNKHSLAPCNGHNFHDMEELTWRTTLRFTFFVFYAKILRWKFHFIWNSCLCLITTLKCVIVTFLNLTII